MDALADVVLKAMLADKARVKQPASVLVLTDGSRVGGDLPAHRFIAHKIRENALSDESIANVAKEISCRWPGPWSMDKELSLDIARAAVFAILGND